MFPPSSLERRRGLSVFLFLRLSILYLRFLSEREGGSRGCGGHSPTPVRIYFVNIDSHHWFPLLLSGLFYDL